MMEFENKKLFEKVKEYLDSRKDMTCESESETATYRSKDEEDCILMNGGLYRTHVIKAGENTHSQLINLIKGDTENI